MALNRSIIVLFSQLVIASLILFSCATSDFYWAINYGNYAEVERMIDEGYNIDRQTKKYSSLKATPLMIAITKGQHDIAVLLIERGADVNVTQRNGSTALLYSFKKIGGSSYSGEVARLLIEKGADVNAEDYSGTALMGATEHDDSEVVKLLIESGANIHAQNDEGRTVLAHASMWSTAEIVELLIESGADIETRDSRGETALMAASNYGTPEVAEQLIRYGADINAQDKHGNTALAKASLSGNVDTAWLLIKNGASIELGDENGVTPLMCAAEYGAIDVARLLIDEGADVNARTTSPIFWETCGCYGNQPVLGFDSGTTVLMFACEGYGYGENKEVIKMLIENGADVNAQDDGGETALSLYGYGEIEELLKEAGAVER